MNVGDTNLVTDPGRKSSEGTSESAQSVLWSDFGRDSWGRV